MPDRYVFVVGSGRSGTSLARTLLNAGPSVALAPETHFLDQWLPRFWQGHGRDIGPLWAEYRTSAHFTQLGLKPEAVDALGRCSTDHELFRQMLDAYADEHRAVVGGEKTAAHFRHVGRLLRWFPDGRVLFVVRDVRAVVGSLDALKFAWADGNLHKHTALWKDAAVAALRWRDHPRVEVIRYEDLVVSPQSAARDALSRLVGEEFDPRWLQDRCTDPSAERIEGSLSSVSPVSDSRLRSWEGRLSPGDAAAIRRDASPLMEKLGYPAPESTPPWRNRASFSAGGVANATARVVRAASNPRPAMRRIRYRLSRP